MKTQTESEIREYSQDWYTMGRNFLPEFETPQFSRIAGNSTTFAYNVNPKNEGTIQIRLAKNIDTAYVDLASQTIFISEKYFSSELYNERYDSPEKIEELAIALINGSTIHESLHILHTENRGMGTIPEILALHTDFYTYQKEYGINLLSTIFNVTEDLYIDSQVSKRLEQWLQNRAEILFPEDSLNEMEVNGMDLNSIINLMIYYKNKAIRNNDQFDYLDPEIMDIIKELTNGIFKGQYYRIGLTFKLVDLLPEFSSDESGDGEAGEDGEKSEIGGEIPDELKSLLASIDSLSDDDFEKIASEISEESAEIAESENPLESHGGIEWKKLLEEDVLKMGIGTYGTYRMKRIEPTSEINFSFLKELQAIRTLNRTIGQARTRGSVMVKSRLTRIATDGKIFAKMDTEKNTLRRIEVIINVDFSASTMGSVINNELGAAKEMSKVLKSARIAHSVYGHTSRDSDIPLLIHIFSYDMKTTNPDWKIRFEKAEYIALSENFDGVVIKELQNKFTGKNAMRYIVNLSDGYPQAPGYTGTRASDHTTVVIEQTRKLGIGVFAISVVESVVYSNDRIYGKENNIDGSRNVNAQFRSLIRKLVS